MSFIIEKSEEDGVLDPTTDGIEGRCQQRDDVWPGRQPGCRFVGLKARPFSDVGSRTPPDPEGSNGRDIQRVLQPAWPSSLPL